MCARLMLRGELAVVTATWRYAFDGRDDAPQASFSQQCCFRIVYAAVGGAMV